MTVEEVGRALDAAGISAWCITPHIYTREFTAGAFTNPDPAVRRRALEICEQGVDAARRLGAPTVKLWPGQDGFDYPFQADYRSLWQLELEGVRAVADMDPDIRVAIEYKTKEPRIHISLATAARTLIAIQQLQRDDVGIVVDLGHSIFAKETPADVLSLVNDLGRLFTIEVNDNWREWDDDLAVGSVHLIETLEFFQEVRKIGWDQPILLDQFPFREDPVEAARSSIQTMRQIDAVLDRLDADALREAQERQDSLAAQRLVLDLLLGGVPESATR
jgi:xylose isomerase